MAGPGDELVFAPLGGVGEIGMNLALYGLGERAPPAVDRGRPRGRLRRRRPARASTSSFPTSATWSKSAATCSASCSPTPTRTISARCSTSGRGCGCRSMRPRSPPRCSRPSARASRARPTSRSMSSPLNSRFTLGPFDIELVSMAHSIPESNGLIIRTRARRRAPHRRLEDRSDAGHRPADRRGQAARARRRGLSGADRRFDQRGARGPLAVRDRRRKVAGRADPERARAASA